uniref:Uncharacterized protein n=1 Tax=Solanum tuberosum TaxID=4113 RepID=M1DML7_SOLTU
MENVELTEQILRTRASVSSGRGETVLEVIAKTPTRESFSLGSAIGTPHVPLTGVGEQTPGLHHSPVILDQVFIVFKNWCYEGSFGAVSRDRRCTRRSAFRSGSSPFSFCLQHLRVLNHWVIWNCFAELLGDAPTALFPRKLDLFLQGSVHWNIRRELRLFSDSPN